MKANRIPTKEGFKYFCSECGWMLLGSGPNLWHEAERSYVHYPDNAKPEIKRDKSECSSAGKNFENPDAVPVELNEANHQTKATT